MALRMFRELRPPAPPCLAAFFFFGRGGSGLSGPRDVLNCGLGGLGTLGAFLTLRTGSPAIMAPLRPEGPPIKGFLFLRSCPALP